MSDATTITPPQLLRFLTASGFELADKQPDAFHLALVRGEQQITILIDDSEPGADEEMARALGELQALGIGDPAAVAAFTAARKRLKVVLAFICQAMRAVSEYFGARWDDGTRYCFDEKRRPCIRIGGAKGDGFGIYIRLSRSGDGYIAYALTATPVTERNPEGIAEESIGHCESPQDMARMVVRYMLHGLIDTLSSPIFAQSVEDALAKEP